MVVDVLKWAGQWPSSKQVLVILIIPLKHDLSLRIHLRCLYKSLSRLGADELLHFTIELMNFSSEKGIHGDVEQKEISLRISLLTCWSCTILKDKYKVYHRIFILRHSHLLYLTASITESLHLWTQFISFQGPHFLLEISWILRSKKEHLVFLTVLLNCFQSSNLLEVLYMLRSLLQLTSYQLLEYTVISTTFEFFVQILSKELANLLTMLSRWAILLISDMLILLSDSVSSLMKVCFLLLSLTIEHFLVWTCFSTIGIMTVRGTWSEVSLQSEWIKWLSILLEPNHRNIRLMTELVSWILSEYLVRTWLVGTERSRLKQSAMINKLLLKEKW